MELNLPELEQRLSNLQSQVERLWQRAEGNAQPVEQRLLGMADQYADYLKRWAITVERHTQAVTRLESYLGEWEDASSRVHQDTSQRFQQLEAIIQREWDTLRQIHEQPVKELREQAASLTEICIATASAAQQGFDRAEARLASFENGFHRRVSELTRELQSAVAEIKARPEHQPALLDSAAQWSLDDVTRLHGQLRDSGSVVRPAGNFVHSLDQPAVSGPPDLPLAIAARIDGLRNGRTYPPSNPDNAAGRILSDAQPSPEQPIPRKWRVAVVCLGLAVIIAGGFGWRLQNQVRAAAGRVQVAELESQKAAADAARQAAAAREEAAREIASARELANNAQRIGYVLAAPDLIRYNLAGDTGAPGASGQALWSRSRGFVFSGSGVPPPPLNGTHQVWLLTRLAPVKAGTFAPEPDGTVTLVQQAPTVPRAVVGVMVTAERDGGDSPFGETVLTSVRPVQ